MQDTTFNPAGKALKALRATLIYPERKMLHALVLDALAYIDSHHTTATPPPYKLPPFSRVEFMKLSHDSAKAHAIDRLERQAAAMGGAITPERAEEILRTDLRHEMSVWYTRALHMFETVELADMTLRHRHAAPPEASNEPDPPAPASPLDPTNLNPSN
jgi:hypothetical protein